MLKKVEILEIPIDNVTMESALKNLDSYLLDNKKHKIFTPNAEIIMESTRSPDLKKVLLSADMLLPDGAGVVMASHILKNKLQAKVPGFDFVKSSFNYKFTKKEVSYFFLGSKPGIAEEAALKVSQEYPNIKIAGHHSGYFKEDELMNLIEKINSLSPDILLVALGAPKQEFWIHQYQDKLNAKVLIGVGGTLDILSGKVELAPAHYRKYGFEWLYRLKKEPWRYKRMLDLPRFTIKVIKKRLFNT